MEIAYFKKPLLFKLNFQKNIVPLFEWIGWDYSKKLFNSSFVSQTDKQNSRRMEKLEIFKASTTRRNLSDEIYGKSSWNIILFGLLRFNTNDK